MHGGSADDYTGPFNRIASVFVHHADPRRFQALRHLVFRAVAAPHGKAASGKRKSKAAHGYAADPDETCPDAWFYEFSTLHVFLQKKILDV